VASWGWDGPEWAAGDVSRRVAAFLDRWAWLLFAAGILLFTFVALVGWLLW
jgi:hypothetical protein